MFSDVKRTLQQRQKKLTHQGEEKELKMVTNELIKIEEILSDHL